MLTLRDAADSEGRAHGAIREVNIWHDDEGRVFGRAFSSSSVRSLEWAGVGTFFFDRLTPVVTVRRLPGTTWARAHETFARTLQPLILQARGFESLHASGVLVSGAVVALAGSRFSGKSTLAHAMTCSGLTPFADDVVVLSCDGTRGVTAHSIPFAPRLRPESRDYFDQALVKSPPEAVDVPPTAPLGAIVILKQDASMERQWTLTRIPAGEAFRALLPHAHMFDLEDVDERRRVVAHYLVIASGTPVYDLLYRPDFESLPGLVATMTSLVEPVAAT